MTKLHYEYLLPIFVGHPFQATYTQEFRDTIQAVCNRMNELEHCHETVLLETRVSQHLRE